jgi:hypothetical protein
MAKDYQKGAGYRLNINTGSYASPVWSAIKGVGDIGVNPNPDDVAVPERGGNTGHMHGEQDPEITFTLYEDTGDTNAETLIAALHSGDMVHVAISRGLMATNGTKYQHMESCLFADLSANRPDPSSYQVTARKHANSDNNFARATISI